MAAPLAYEQPTINRAWEAFVAHVPTILLIWIATAVLAGLFFSLVMTIGFVLCIVPGIVVALVMPIYVNRIFLTDQSITDAFAASFQAVYRSANGPDFLGIEILAWVLVVVVSVCTCGLGALLAVPVSSFYLQNVAYHKGLIS